MLFRSEVLGLSRPAKAENFVTMTGTVAGAATLVPSSTAPQTLSSTRYDLSIGTLTSGLSWSGASLGLYLNQGRFAAVPSVTITDAAGAALAVTATGTVKSASGSATSMVSYQFSGTLPDNAVLHFSDISLYGLSGATVGSAVQVIAAASGAANSWHRYAMWQSLATIASSGSQTVTPESGWWWSSSESGRGYAIEVADGRIMLAAYMYRSDGTSVWYVANGALSGNSFSGSLKEYAGGATLASSSQTATELGDVATVTLTFASATRAYLTWSGAAFTSGTVTTSLSRYSFTGSTAVTPPTSSDGPHTGWYWNSSESGTGWFVEVQGTQAFVAVYMYDADGTARWYVAQGYMTQSGGVFGASTGYLLEATLTEYANGQTLTSGTQTGLLAVPKGTVTLQFASSTTATAILPGGRTQVLTRFTGF